MQCEKCVHLQAVTSYYALFVHLNTQIGMIIDLMCSNQTAELTLSGRSLLRNTRVQAEQ